VDGSSRVIQGKRHNGYSIIDEVKLKVIKSGRLPNNWSAQTCELFALNQALKFLKNKGTIYTDSKYAFRMAHTFGKIWAERELINSKGKELIIRLLENLVFPEEIAIVPVPRQGQQGVEADEAAKEAAIRPETPLLHLTAVVQTLSLTPVFTPKERAQLGKLVTFQTLEGKWLLSNGREVLSRPI
jgi:ribonuclease HI